MEISPAAILSMWAAGVIGTAGVVAWWDIVGRGFSWLTSGTTVLLGVSAALASGSASAWVGTAIGLGLIFLAGSRRLFALGAAVASVCFIAAAASETPAIAALSGAAFLGGITSEMLLGHWYLVDPRLPRWSLRALVAGGAVAAIIDVAVVIGFGAVPWPSGDGPVGVGFIVLAVATLVLLVGVHASLREEGYSGVMAATGLSYLALLTAIGTAILGRMLASGPVLS